MSSPPTCSFCGKAPDDDNGLIMGPPGVAICHTCAVLTCAVVLEERQAAGKDPLASLLGGLIGAVVAPPQDRETGKVVAPPQGRETP